MCKTGIINISENAILNQDMPRTVPKFRTIAKADFEVFVPYHAADKRKCTILNRDILGFRRRRNR